MEIKKLIEQAHENAVKHGFWDDWDSICWEDGLKKNEDSTLNIQEMFNNATGNKLMLIVSELAEAQSGLRHNNMVNFKEELADVAIRLGDLCGGLDIDLQAEIIKKMDKNKLRPYKHRKEF